MTVFDRAWSIVKMPPYYHGTSSKYLDSIRQRGLLPTSIEESHWKDVSDVPHDEKPKVFFSASENDALLYSLLYGTSDRPEYTDDEAFSYPHRPIVLEIDDEVEDLLGFGRNKGYGDYQVMEKIPPELLSVIFRGPQWREWSDFEDPDEQNKKDWNHYHQVIEDAEWIDPEPLNTKEGME